MKKFLICGDLIEITKNINLLYSYHIQKKINIVGINANEEYYENMFNINYYTYSEIVNLKYDYIILVCNKEYYNEYKDYLLNINNNAKIINYKVFSIPNFDIDKYLDIYNDTPTIFTKNCAAGEKLVNGNCEKCSDGQWSNGGTATSCTSCPAGYACKSVRERAHRCRCSAV